MKLMFVFFMRFDTFLKTQPKQSGSCLLWVMSTEISVDIAVDIAVDSRSIVINYCYHAMGEHVAVRGAITL